MMNQPYRSPLSQATVQCFPKSSWDLVLIEGLGSSTQLRGLPVSDTGISGNGWNSSPFLSMTQQHGNGFYPPTVGHDSKYVYSATWTLPESPPNTLLVR